MLTAAVLSVCGALLVPSDATELGVRVERNVAAEMRDGIVLRADVHRPDRGGPYPVLVRRSPYGKERNFDRYVKAGYIVVSQDARGRFASDGKWESFYRFETHDAEDGYDTVEWAARLPGSTGKVGTFGISYDALLQWRLAALRPPSLGAMAARSVNPFTREASGSIRPGRRLPWWINQMSPDMHRRSNRTLPESYKQWVAGGEDTWLFFLPWLELPDEAFGHEADAIKFWLRNPHTTPRNLHECCKEVAVPNLDVVGWHDHANGDMLMFRKLVTEGKTETARKRSRVIIGPWSHWPQGKRRYGTGNIDYGLEAETDIVGLVIRWFDYWLKGKANGVDHDAPVKIFVMGDNRWRDQQHWPLPSTKEKVLFITSTGNANTPGGDGKLTWQRPKCSNTDQYIYDPKDPVPTLHARFTHATDQRPLAGRRDILVYQTEPLDQRIEVTGNPIVELFAASSAPDTDWIVRLIDAAPDGLARDVSMGLVRARYRHGLDKPELITPGKVVKYSIRMNPTSNAFLKGHRIRLDVTSSDFPNYDRNHNTAAFQNADARLATANQTVYHGGSQATRILLPHVPND